MKYDPNIHHRRSIRLKNYDYSQAGAYFVTICTQGRQCLFGEITCTQMGEYDLEPNKAGEFVWQALLELETRFPSLALDLGN